MLPSKPELVRRERNSVSISWHNENIKSVQIQLQNDLGEWRTIYRGNANRLTIDQLSPCNYYNARIRCDELSTSDWLQFTIATCDGPIPIRHMTRAVKYGRTAQIRKIAHSRPILLDAPNAESKSPLVQAVEKSDLALVSLLITLGADVGAKLPNLRTALMWAIYLKEIPIAKLLIDKGANVTDTDINGLNILHWAVDSDSLESVQLALAQRLDVNSRDNSGWTPLIRATILNCSQEIIDFLIQSGANVRIKDNNGFDFAKHRYIRDLVAMDQCARRHHHDINSSETLMSDSSFESHQGLEIIPKIFTPTRCITRPLVALQRIDNNKDGKELCIYLDGFDYMCRICHGGDSNGDLLTPCKCKGSIAFAHLKCLEIWLNESNSNVCELCQYHFRIVREPGCSTFWSILTFLRHPGRFWKDMLLDFFTFIIYTPSTVTTTYMLMVLCEALAKSSIKFRSSLFSHFIAMVAIFGIATINFTYTSWLVLTMEKYVHIWREWYKQTCTLKVVLSAQRLVPQKKIDSNMPPSS